MIERKHIINC